MAAVHIGSFVSQNSLLTYKKKPTTLVEVCSDKNFTRDGIQSNDNMLYTGRHNSMR